MSRRNEKLPQSQATNNGAVMIDREPFVVMVHMFNIRMSLHFQTLSAIVPFDIYCTMWHMIVFL